MFLFNYNDFKNYLYKLIINYVLILVSILKKNVHAVCKIWRAFKWPQNSLANALSYDYVSWMCFWISNLSSLRLQPLPNIPTPKYSASSNRGSSETKVTTLDNGLRVASENVASSFCTVGGNYLNYILTFSIFNFRF